MKIKFYHLSQQEKSLKLWQHLHISPNLFVNRIIFILFTIYKILHRRAGALESFHPYRVYKFSLLYTNPTDSKITKNHKHRGPPPLHFFLMKIFVLVYKLAVCVANKGKIARLCAIKLIIWGTYISLVRKRIKLEWLKHNETLKGNFVR